MFQEGFKELLDEFLLEAHERADEVEASLLRLRSPDPEEAERALTQAKRELHTLKGNAGMMGFIDLQQLAHHMEDEVEVLDLAAPQIDILLNELDILRQTLHTITPEHDGSDATDGQATHQVDVGPYADGESRDIGGSVRVPFVKIDQLVELQAETLIYRNRLSDSIQQAKAALKETLPTEPIEQSLFMDRINASWDEVDYARQALEKTLRQLQEQTTNLGMVPLQGLFRSLRRVIHDESSRQDKKVDLEIFGGDTPIDKTLLEAAADALGHLVRNAVIHGIERPAERLAKEKPETGTVRVAATLDANQIWIEVADDGRGIDMVSLRHRAAALGSDHSASSDFTLLFEVGISSHAGTDIGAGRGVGMAAVKQSVESHGGRIEVQSRQDVGTIFTLRLPVTASILRSLLLEADGEGYALPLISVVEALSAREQERHTINGAPVVKWRRQLVPIIDIGHLFGTRQDVRTAGTPIIIEINGRYRALLIDDIVGIRDIVVKSLDSLVGRPQGISGSTILGDGRVLMILDPAILTTLSPFVSSEPARLGK